MGGRSMRRMVRSTIASKASRPGGAVPVAIARDREGIDGVPGAASRTSARDPQAPGCLDRNGQRLTTNAPELHHSSGRHPNAVDESAAHRLGTHTAGTTRLIALGLMETRAVGFPPGLVDPFRSVHRLLELCWLHDLDRCAAKIKYRDVSMRH